MKAKTARRSGNAAGPKSPALPATQPTRPGLTPEEFRYLAGAPPEVEWLANIVNPRTAKAYRMDVREFMRFAGIQRSEELGTVARAHVIAWRKTLEDRGLARKKPSITWLGLGSP